MCAPKNASAPTTGRGGLTPAPSFPGTPFGFETDSGDFGDIEVGGSPSFTRFDAPAPRLNPEQRGQSLRFPGATKIEPTKVETPELKTVKPALPPLPTEKPAPLTTDKFLLKLNERVAKGKTDSFRPKALKTNPEINSVYDFGETPPPEKFSQKIAKDIQQNHREMTDYNNRNRASLEETFTDERNGNFKIQNFVKGLQEKYGSHDPDDPEVVGYDHGTATLHNKKIRREFIQDQIETRQREGHEPSVYSEEGLSVEDLHGVQKSPEQIRQDREKRQNFYRRLEKFSEDETLTPIDHSRSLVDDEKTERLWSEINKSAEKIFVPVITESVRQPVQMIENMINKAIIGKNYISGVDTKAEHLVHISKPERSKHFMARLAGSLLTGGPFRKLVGKVVLSPSKTIQKMHKGSKLQQTLAKQTENGVGMILTSENTDMIITDAFKYQKELLKEVRNFQKGKISEQELRTHLLDQGGKYYKSEFFDLMMSVIKIQSDRR